MRERIEISESAKTQVLLAEEDVVQRTLIREYLRMESRYEVLDTEGIRPLLDLCAVVRFRNAVVLLDMRWSKAGKTDVVLEIRKRNPGMRILGLMDRDGGASAKSYLGMLRFGILFKPFSADRLHRSLAAILATDAGPGDRNRGGTGSRPCPKP
ncbi:MAG TPA: hypothetical protein VJ385_10240 [Fibrobacteria bacterium]|nr:hypothetical protein [Fibrobacteria bacterium]